MARKPAQILPPDCADVYRALIAANADAYIQTTQVEDISRAGKLTDFKYNYEQQRISHFLRWHEVRGKPGLLMVLKTRQKGVSTQIARRNWVKTWAQNNMLSITVAQLEATATSLLDKMRSAYKRLEPWEKWKLGHDSDEQIHFSDFDSRMWIVSTATLKTVERAVRGKTAHLLHGTECPLWPDFLLQLSEFLSFWHAVEGALGVLEFTGRGRDSQCHKYWNKCKKGIERFTALFLAWQDDPATHLDVAFWTDEEKRRRMMEVGLYDRRLLEMGLKYRLSEGQVWYAYCYLKDIKLGNFEKFLEDMPPDDELAWQAIGNLYFEDNDMIKVADRAKQVAYLAYDITLKHLEEGFHSQTPDGGDFRKLRENLNLTHEAEEPAIFLWEPPAPGDQYVIGSFSTTGSQNDAPSVSYVINKIDGRMMCSFRGKVKPHQHANIINSLGQIYNLATAAPEVRTPEGMATLGELNRLRYPRLYIWRRFDDAEEKLTNRLGWYTGPMGRELTMTLLARVLQQAAEGFLPIHAQLLRDRGLISEMQTFIVDPDSGALGPQPNCYDTRIKAIAIAWFVGDMETRGMGGGLLESLRPCQILVANQTLGIEPGSSVAEMIKRAKNYLTREGYTFHEKESGLDWW